MRKLFLVIILLVFLSLIYANAVIEFFEVVSEVWFNADDHLMVEFYPYGDEFYLNSLKIEHGGFSEVIPDSTFVTFGNPPVVRDITALMPNMVFDPANDTLVIRDAHDDMMYYRPHLAHLKWGSDFSNDVNAPLPGQSMARGWVWYANYFESVAWLVWAKDEPPTPGANAYFLTARSFLKVKVIDQDNNPVSYVSVFHINSPPNAVTDKNGDYSAEILPGKVSVVLYNPITYAEAFRQTYWVEPYDTLEVTSQITMPESYPYSTYLGLHAFPMPFSFSQGNRINFRYYGEYDVTKSSYIKLYDIKGRYIDKIDFGFSGEFFWYPPQDVATGVYIAQFINGNRILDTITFTIIK